VFYGGTDLSGKLAAFVELLAETVMEGDDRIALVTGGFRHRHAARQAHSVDWAAVTGATRALKRRSLALDDFIETWLPEQDMDRRDVERFEAGTSKIRPGQTAQARRFALVQGADALVTFAGKVNTAMVLDMALAIDRPSLPLPFTGGDSRTYWKDNRSQIMKWFGIKEPFARTLEKVNLDTMSDEERRRLARRIRDALLIGIRRECLVLMPYDSEPERAYLDSVKPIIEDGGFYPVRVDQNVDAGLIYDSFIRSLESSACVIADVTENNPNVMYEIGHAHSREIFPFLFSRGKDPSRGRPRRPRPPKTPPPFYLVPHRVNTLHELGAFLARVRRHGAERPA
jgi:hypothetical protein